MSLITNKLEGLSDNGVNANQANNLEIKKRYPGLEASGTIISAVFCIPFKLSLRSDENWILKCREGNSALYSSLNYLSSSETHWNHKIVGWTGEVSLERDTKCSVINGAKSTNEVNGLSKVYPPIHVDNILDDSSENDIPQTIRISRHHRDKLEQKLKESSCGEVLPVWLANEEDADGTLILSDQQRWRRYAEYQLYTVFHYMPKKINNSTLIRNAWNDYYQMNRRIADKILEQYQPGDIVIVHDYNLLLVPGFLREKKSNIYVGFFLHIPFPSSEFFRCLANRKEILEAVLKANMIGFQSFSYLRHFSFSCYRILGTEAFSLSSISRGNQASVNVFPIGINFKATIDAAFNDNLVEGNILRIKQMFQNKKIIVGRDRLDAVSGVAQKLLAFEKFLEQYPQWREEVILIQITSREAKAPRFIEDDRKSLKKISDLVTKINGTYGTLDFQPVKQFLQYLPRSEYFALLRAADIGLITSVRDGMNTTGLEYIICQRDNHGPLILSEFSGTASGLDEAIHVNPWDFGGVAKAIDYALNMTSEEKTSAHTQLFEYVKNNDIVSWTNRFIDELAKQLSSSENAYTTPIINLNQVIQQYVKAKKRLFLLDYDGTLTPIVKDPQSAIPSDKVIRTIKTLASDPANLVWIVSGRDQAFLDEWMGHISELGLSAEHGSFIRYPNSDHWINLVETKDISWQNEVLEILHRFTEQTQGSFIERKKIAITWHYRQALPEYGTFQAEQCHKALKNALDDKYDAEIMVGKSNLEVRPRSINKGEIVKKLLKQYSAQGSKLDFILCLGDDYTDEYMFETLRHSDIPKAQVFTCKVGNGSYLTSADWHIFEPAEVISLISALNSCEVKKSKFVDHHIKENESSSPWRLT